MNNPWKFDSLVTDWLERNDPQNHWKSKHFRAEHRGFAKLPEFAEEVSADALDQEDFCDLSEESLSYLDNEDSGHLAEIRYQRLKDGLLEALANAHFTKREITVWDLLIEGKTLEEIGHQLGVTKQSIHKTKVKTKQRVLFLAKIIIAKESAARNPTQPMLPSTPPPAPGVGQQMDLFSDDFGGAE
jgi:DNA-binding CsgD family transcriptional regulator